MSYEAWRISYQSSEQAARAAYSGLQSTSTRLHEVAVACANAEAERDALRAELDALNGQKDEALNTLCKVFHAGEEFEGPDGMIMAVDLALWNEGCEAIERLVGGEEDGASPYARPVPAPSVPDGFSREDLEAVADGLDGYEKTVNVGNVTGEGDDHLESTTAYAARFIRTMLAAAPEAKP